MHMPVSQAAARTPTAAGLFLLALCLTFISSPLFASTAALAHAMRVTLDPDDGTVSVADTLRTDQKTTRFEFILNAGLAVTTEDGTLQALETSADGLRTAYRVTVQTPVDSLKLQYHGKPRFSGRRSLGDMPQGIIAPQGIYLDGASAWYPQFDVDAAEYEVTVTLPPGWQSVSIGRRQASDGGPVTWTTERPYDELYLIAGRFTRHLRRHGGIDLSVWLLDDDPALAGRYLDLMGGYIDHYGRLIGPYPYEKFAVVENPWQTGFGMPSFTLLGSRVLRLPFIPYTSLPHEILHNWWGNGVWVDYANGNWSEGLTAYLADHWMQEREGKGDQYRLKALQRYSNFAARGEDMPLLAFVSRHDDSTQSVGYSKSLMLFHMLRGALGDDAFVAGLQRLWRDYRYRRVGFTDAVRAITGPDTATAQRFMPWLERTGAPSIRLADVQTRQRDGGWQLDLAIEQAQPEAFEFDLPVWVTLEGEPLAQRETVHVAGARVEHSLRLASRPLRIDVDAGYDVLRTLDPTEQPPALNRLFGSNGAWLVVPSSAPPAMRDAWGELAAVWLRRYPGLRVTDDRNAGRIAPDADRILLGWENALLPAAREALARDDQRLGAQDLAIGAERYPGETHGIVLVNTDARGVTTGLVAAPTPEAVRTLAPKLTHYGSYGRLVFDAQGGNLVRDSLTSTHSRLSRQLGPEPVSLQLPPRPPLGGPD
jgi:hypothetical protein